MSYTRYGRKGLFWEELSSEELLEKLADYLLHSGFMDGWQAGDWSLDELRQAILQALLSQPVIPLEELERLLEMEQQLRDSQLGQMVDQLIQRLIDEGWLSVPELEQAAGRVGLPGEARFELTGKGIDFLGFKTLQQVLGRARRGSFGRHDTRQLATGVEAPEAPKPYEFGDTLNLDPAATVLEAVKRQGLRLPLDLDYADLRVHQSERSVSAATVVMLDCSHSMILYGEDRFTPAKRVALALSHLIRTQYAGDELSLVLFHDSAEEVPLSALPRVQIGPWHTNTAAGLSLARRILARTRREMRQVVMITDGKPSAITLPDGRTYTNSFGLDPLILGRTFEEVAACRRAGILINTFMLASDRALVGFVKQVSQIARGKAYFTTPDTLGRYVAMDYMSNKVETIH